MPSLERYCSDFCGSDQAWPDLPLPRAAFLAPGVALMDQCRQPAADVVEGLG